MLIECFEAYSSCIRDALSIQAFLLRRLKLHGQNHIKCTQFGPCKKNVFYRLCFLKTEY